jgi:hypothetical protein
MSNTFQMHRNKYESDGPSVSNIPPVESLILEKLDQAIAGLGPSPSTEGLKERVGKVLEMARLLSSQQRRNIKKAEELETTRKGLVKLKSELELSRQNAVEDMKRRDEEHHKEVCFKATYKVLH